MFGLLEHLFGVSSSTSLAGCFDNCRGPLKGFRAPLEGSMPHSLWSTVYGEFRDPLKGFGVDIRGRVRADPYKSYA